MKIILIILFLPFVLIYLFVKWLFNLTKKIGGHMEVLFFPFILIYLFIKGILILTLKIITYIYYNSKAFLDIKANIEHYTKECNDLNQHIEELKNTYNNTYTHQTLGKATYNNTSNYKYKKRFLNDIKNSNQTVDCSLAVSRNVQREPFKYLCKYFNIPQNEDTLARFENILNDFSAAEQGKELLKNKEEEIFDTISNEIPYIIKKFDKQNLYKKLGFSPIDFSQLYFPKYTFKYVSPGGNSSNTVDIIFNLENLNDFIKYLNSKIQFNKSIKKQRSLMTLELREKIKQRDDYTCKNCGISTHKEPHLLLEIDHIIPISKGGLTYEENLQTLCWKCNRSKSNKIQSVQN